MEDSNTSPISKLSREILLELFQFLDAKSLKETALVCRRWDDVISTSISTMRKFELRLWLENISDEKFAELLASRRKFVSLKLFDGNNEKNNSRILNVINKFRAQLRDLRTSAVLFFDMVNTGLFSLIFPLLETLELSAERKEFEALGHQALPKPHPRDWSNFYHKYPKNFDLESFISFLQATLKLECLKCNGSFISENFLNAKGLSFKLKKLIMLGFIDNDKEEIFVKFLQKHASTLEEIEYSTSSRLIHSFVLSMKKLTIWRGCLDLLPEDNEFYLQRQSTNIKQIHSLRQGCDKIAEGFLKICPNLEVLGVQSEIVRLMKPFLALHNPKIKTLTLRLLTDIHHFPQLKSLTVEFVYQKNQLLLLKAFLEINQTIERLTIKNLNNFAKASDFKFLTEYNIKHLKIGGEKHLRELKPIFDDVEGLTYEAEEFGIEGSCKNYVVLKGQKSIK